MPTMIAKPTPVKKGNLKIDYELHGLLTAKAATSSPRQGLNNFAEDVLWEAVGGKPRGKARKSRN